MPEDNIWSDWLEDFPQEAYYSAAPFGSAIDAGPTAASPFGGGFAPAAQQYWSGQYGNVVNQYMGQWGRSLRAGQKPSMTFTDFLEQYPWTQRYSALSPRMRPGGTTSRFAPAVRRMY